MGTHIHPDAPCPCPRFPKVLHPELYSEHIITSAPWAIHGDSPLSHCTWPADARNCLLLPLSFKRHWTDYMVITDAGPLALLIGLPIFWLALTNGSTPSMQQLVRRFGADGTSVKTSWLTQLHLELMANPGAQS